MGLDMDMDMDLCVCIYGDIVSSSIHYGGYMSSRSYTDIASSFDATPGSV